MRNKSYWFAELTALALFLSLQALGTLSPALISSCSWAAAWLAATALGVPLEGDVAPIVAHPLFPLEIVPTCSGWSFFCLLAALLVGRAVVAAGRQRRRFWLAALAIPLAAAITLLVNAARFVAVIASGLFVLPHLPPLVGASFHTAMGVTVFLPALLVVYTLWERSLDHV